MPCVAGTSHGQSCSSKAIAWYEHGWYMLQYIMASHAEPMTAFWYNMLLKTHAWQEAMDRASLQANHSQWQQQAAQLLQQNKRLRYLQGLAEPMIVNDSIDD